MGVVASGFVRVAAVLLLACLLPAVAGWAQSEAAGQATRIYGVEVETSPARDRVLVFGDGLLRPRVDEVDAGTLMLSFPGSRLDPSAPREIAPEPGGAVQSVTVFETADEPREVRITVLRTAGVKPSLSQRGGQVALDFRRPGRVMRPEPGEPAVRTLDARWLNLRTDQAVTRLARFLDRRLILDEDTLRGTVSVEAPGPITQGEAAALLDSLLLLKGLAVVEAPGGVGKIVALAANPGRWVESLAREPGGEALVTLVPLQEVDAGLAVQAVTPLVGDSGFIQLYAPTNSVLLAGVQSRLARIARVLRELDRQGATRVVLIALRHADAERAAEALEQAFPRERSLRVWPDARTQRLIVRGGYETIERVREFVARVDRPATSEGRLQVVPVLYSDVERMASMLRELATGGGDARVRGAGSLAGRDFAVSVHAPTHSLVVQADPSTIAIVREVIAEIDRPPRRVMVEAGVTEVSFSSSLRLSLDSLLPLTDPEDATDLVAVAVVSPSGAVLDTSSEGAFFGRIARSPILIPILDPMSGQTLVLPIPRETAVLTADSREVRSRILMQPRLSVASGEEHEIFAGNNVPVPTATAAASANPLRTSQTVERRDAGISLRVKPTIPEEGPIRLEVALELSEFSGALSGGPTFIERTVDVQVYLESGRSAVIASAALPSRTYVRQGVPFLMDIPILGSLFRFTREMERNTHLLVTLRADHQRPEAEVLTGWMLQQLADDESDLAAADAP